MPYFRIAYITVKSLNQIITPQYKSVQNSTWLKSHTTMHYIKTAGYKMGYHHYNDMMAYLARVSWQASLAAYVLK